MLRVYWNLHKKMWSVQSEGIVVGRYHLFCLAGITFKVSNPGRMRVIETRKKNVHAFICGQHPRVGDINTKEVRNDGIEISYNPYTAGFFYDRSCGQEVISGDYAMFEDDKTVKLLNPVYGDRSIV